MQTQQPLTLPTASNVHPPHSLTVVTGRRKPDPIATSVKPSPQYGQLPPVNLPSLPMSSSQPSPSTFAATSAGPRDRSHLPTLPHSAFTRPEVAAALRREPIVSPGTQTSPGAHQVAPFSASQQPPQPPPGQETLFGRNYYPQRAAIPSGGLPPGAQISQIGRVTGPFRTAGKSSRRGKTHVQKACVNCKKAHLSCDAKRPCARCMTSGKQDSCHDVEHKKRGRPRLRDDRDSRPGRDLAPTEPLGVQTQPRSGYSSSISSSPAHRRTQSGRILRSHRPSVGQSAPPLATLRHTIGSDPSSSSSLARSPAARVFVNLNFRILRANKAFQEQFASGAEVRGRAFIDFVDIRHEHDLQRLGTDLRTEREQRDPMALPTIFSDQEQQAIDSIDENHIDAYVRGSRERSESWHFIASQGSMQRPLLVQLGQVGTFAFVLFTMPYSVSMTLPPLPTTSAFFQPQQPGQSGLPPFLDSTYSPRYPQSGSGSTTPSLSLHSSLSLQSLAATLPPASATVGLPSYGPSARFSSGSSDIYSSHGRGLSSQQSPVSTYAPHRYPSTASSSGTRPQSTISEPLSSASRQSSMRRNASLPGQPRIYGAKEAEIEPVPNLPSALEALKAQALLQTQQEEGDGDEGRKRRRLDITELTD